MLSYVNNDNSSDTILLNDDSAVSLRASNSLHSNSVSILSSASYSNNEIRKSLQLLDDQFITNTLTNRRNFRPVIQDNVIKNNGSIIREFGAIASNLQKLGSALHDINHVFMNMSSHVTFAKNETIIAVSESRDLISQRDQTNAKTDLLRVFMECYMLSEADIETLLSPVAGIDARFFTILARVQKIHADCHTLLTSRNTKLGEDVMEHMTKHLNTSFQTLFLWVQRELKNVTFDNPRIDIMLCKSLQVLSGRQILFQKCLDSLVENRENVLLESLLHELSGNREESIGKPIEMVAHDPLRYVGDIFAWLHSALVSEVEALDILLRMADEGPENVEYDAAYLSHDEITPGPLSLRKSLADRSLSSASKFMKNKLEQIVFSHESAVLIYEISNLIDFYSNIFKKILGPTSILGAIMESISDFTYRQFHNSLQDNVRAVQKDLPKVPDDLGPPEFLLHALTDLRSLMESYKSSLAPSNDPSAFNFVYDDALDPYLQGCWTLSKDLPDPDSDIFMLNCLSLIKNTLELFAFAGSRLHMLEDPLTAHRHSLVEYQHSFFLQTLGLYPLLENLSTWDLKYESLSSIESLSSDTIMMFSASLDKFLPTALIDAQSQLRQLASPTLRSSITQDAVSLFQKDFVFVKDVVANCGKPEVSQNLRHTLEDIQILLS